jgi:hypothetical protein
MNMDEDIGVAARAPEAPHSDRVVVASSPGFPALRRQFLAVGLAALALLWGTWATHAILGLKSGSTHLVKVQLADLVREYVQGQARSGMPADQVTAQTTAYLKALNETVSAHARGGTVVLLANAVVDGSVPDITMAVRQEVYARVPHPQPGQAQGMSPQMQQFFDANGASSGNRK